MKLVLLLSFTWIGFLTFGQISVVPDDHEDEANIRYTRDSVITYFPNGSIKLIQLDHELEEERSKKGLPVIFQYRENGTLELEAYLSYNLYHSVYYSESNANCPTNGSNELEGEYDYENCKMIRKTSRKYRNLQYSNTLSKDKIPYCVEEGSFKNFILLNGSMKYYDAENKLITTVQVQSSKRINDPVIYFKDSVFLLSILRGNPGIDMNHNGHIEKSEALTYKQLTLWNPKGVTSVFGLSHFKNMEHVNVSGTALYPKNYASQQKLLEAILTNIHKPIPVPNPKPPRRPDFDLQPPQQPEIIDFCDILAEFPGGPKAMQEWIMKNLIYPEEAIEANEQGKVYVSFVVEPEGNLTNINVEKGICKSLDREAKRLIRTMPLWIPGQVKSKRVRTRVRVPITFRLE